MCRFILLRCIFFALLAIPALTMAGDDIAAHKTTLMLSSGRADDSGKERHVSTALTNKSRRIDNAAQCQYWILHLKSVRNKSSQAANSKDNYSYIRGKRVLAQAHIDTVNNCAFGVGVRTVYFAEICRLARLVLNQGEAEVLGLGVSVRQGDSWVRIPIQQHSNQQVRHFCQPPFIDSLLAGTP